VELAMLHEPELIVIEQQWLDLRRNKETGKMRRDPRNALTTARKSGMWVQAWFDNGGTALPIFLEPSTWRKRVLGARASGRYTGDVLKRMARHMVLGIYGERLNEDEAEAAGIARAETFPPLEDYT